MNNTDHLCVCCCKEQEILFLCAVYEDQCSSRIKTAYGAVAHSTLVTVYRILEGGIIFKELGVECYNQSNEERKINT